MRTSHSAMQTYLQCSERYRLEKIEKVEVESFGSALHFGAALDSAFSILLARKLKEPPIETISPVDEFILKFSTFKDKCPYSSLTLTYSNSDIDLDILSEGDYRLIRAFNDRWQLSNQAEVEDFLSILKGATLKSDTQALFNYIAWLSLKAKGLMFIDVYASQILSEIEEVISIQEKIQLQNSESDELVGYIDFIARFKGNVHTYICDNKTSSKRYKEDSVRTSDQLTIYCEAKGMRHAAYVVLEKQIRKKEPKVRWEIIKDVIPEENFERVFDSAIDILSNIKDNNFNKKADKKECYFYGRQCPHFKTCWSSS